jgi:hypothetical protein
MIAATVMPSALPAPATTAPSRRLLDFRPVLLNRVKILRVNEFPRPEDINIMGP